MTFTKLFSSITESTIWCEPAGTRLVWITMLAKCDRKGRVFAAVPGLARLANVTLAECEQAIATLLAPDTYSRTPEHDGRRIEPIDGGWRLLNHAKYRDMRDEETRREQNREAQRRHRERVSKDADSKPKSADPSAHADADADVTAELATLAPRAQANGASRGTDAGRACRLMREAGCARTNPSHADLLAALAEGVTPEVLADTAREAVESGKTAAFAWSIATARSRHREGPRAIATLPARQTPHGPQSRTGQGLAALEALKRHGT